MKKWTLYLLLFVLQACTVKTENSNDFQNQIKLAETTFTELKECIRKDNGKLWQHSLEGPIMLVDRESREIIANQADNEGFLTDSGNLYTGRLPEDVIIANTAVEWNGKRWTMVFLPLPEKQTARMSLLIHESFHRVQPEIGFDSLYDAQCSHLDTRDGRVFLKLEMEALKKALKARDPADHIMNAMLFRKYRYFKFPDGKDAENKMELLEGLAEYTGSILSGRTESELREHYISAINNFYDSPTFVRSFAYYTLPVYGYLMDQKEKGWNLEIRKTTKLSDYIEAFFGFELSMPEEEELLVVAGDYNLDEILETEDQRELERLAKLDEYRKTFFRDSVLSIRLENMRIGFNPSNLIPLDSSGTIYPNLQIVDNWGKLVVDSCGALLSPEWNRVRISYPENISDSLISGKGWRLYLNKDWVLVAEEGMPLVLTRKENNTVQ